MDLEIADDNMNFQKPFVHLFRRSGFGFVLMRFTLDPQGMECVDANFRLRRDLPCEFPNEFLASMLNQVVNVVLQYKPL